MNQFLKLLLAFLAGISLPSLAEEGFKSQSTKKMATRLSHALDMYFVDCKEFPAELQQLVVKPKTCKFWCPKTLSWMEMVERR